MTVDVAIATGGTGGHFFPAQALAESLKKQGYQVHFFIEGRARSLVGPLEKTYTFHFLPIVRLKIPVLKEGILVLSLIYATLMSLFSLSRQRPKVIVGFGGYPSVPLVLAARLLKIPLVLHEQNAVLGRVNRWAQRWAKVLATSFSETRFAKKGTLTGMPVREAILKVREAPYRVDSGILNLLILGGSQGTEIFSRVIPEVIADFPERLKQRLRISHQCRPALVDSTRKAYGVMGVKAVCAAFFEDVGQLLKDSQLVISRAGSSTLAELAVSGRPAILVPYPWAMDDHQTENATHFCVEGAAWSLQQSEMTKETFKPFLEALLQDSKKLEKAAHQMHMMGCPEAIDRLREVIINEMKEE